MVFNTKPSLPVCALGAGLAHAVLLALVLPVLITLPAPADKAQGTVAIQVVVRSAPPPMLEAAAAGAAAMPLPAFFGEGDVDEDAMPAAPLEEVTGALPQVVEQTEALPEYAAWTDAAETMPVPVADQAKPAASAVVLSDMSPADSMPSSGPDAELAGQEVASIDAMELPDAGTVQAVVPFPLRKPALEVLRAPAVVNTPKQRVVPAQRARAQRTVPQKNPAYKGILGGKRASPMAEYPFGGP